VDRCKSLQKENEELKLQIDNMKNDEISQSDFQNDYRLMKNERDAAIDKLAKLQ
jgi:hypothetical protein